MSLWDNTNYTVTKEVKEEKKEEENENENNSSSSSEEEDEQEFEKLKIKLGNKMEELDVNDNSDEEEEENNFKSKKERKEMSLKKHKEEASKTVFIANINIKSKTSEIKKFLKQFGDLESFRLRGAAYIHDEHSKRTHFLKKEYNTIRKTQNCYAVYKNEEDARKASQEINGKEFNGFHLRSDLEENKDKKKNVKRTLFLGNLNKKTEEENVLKFFKDCGEIEQVKIVRNNDSGLSKGIGFITFVEKECLKKAMELNGKKINGNQIRIQPCYKNVEKRNEKRLNRLNKKIEMKKEKKRVYKETVKMNEGKLKKKRGVTKPKK